MDNILTTWDADFIPFYVCWNKRGDDTKSLEDCINLCDELITNINTSLKANEYVGFLGKGKCFRYDINDRYKANRKYDDEIKYLPEVREHLKAYHNFKSLEGFEADDLCISFRTKYKDQYNCIVVSPDKDLLNLEGANYNPKKGELIFRTKNEEELYFWKSMIVGDSADNIAGIKGYGPVAADKIIDKCTYFEGLRGLIFEEYCKVYGEYKGVEEFYKNYKCLKILDNVEMENFVVNKITNNILSD
jgi:DNA polymerase I